MLNILAVDKQAINYAIKRLINFKVVNDTREYEDKISGLQLYLESIGLEEQMVVHLYEICEKYFTEKRAPDIFVGVLLGLAVAENLLDREVH